MNLWGNMLWAGSSFKAANRREEKAMAYSGAFVSSVAERAVKELIGGGGGALEALALLERQVHLSHDAILASLARDLGEDGLDEASPARLNAAVWKRLFPHFPSGLSQAELCVEMRERICGGMAA